VKNSYTVHKVHFAKSKINLSYVVFLADMRINGFVQSCSFIWNMDHVFKILTEHSVPRQSWPTKILTNLQTMGRKSSVLKS